MSQVKLRGIKKLADDLEKRLGKAAMQRITDKGLIEGAKEFEKELKREFETFRDTGASIEEITISPPYTDRGVRTIKIHWKGPDGRFRIIHLNEWGTIKNPNPRGKGAVARAMKNAEKAYRDAVKKALKAGV